MSLSINNLNTKIYKNHSLVNGLANKPHNLSASPKIIDSLSN